MLDSKDLHIREGSIWEAAQFAAAIPEFPEITPLAEFERRLTNVPHLLLFAEQNGQVVGFKVGYAGMGYNTFYSWLGGVLPQYRRNGIARLLADCQEEWAAAHGYDRIVFKTRNRFNAMLLFGLKNGFSIIDFYKKNAATPDDYRLVLSKNLC